MNWYKTARSPNRRNKLENYTARLCREIFPFLKNIETGQYRTLRDGEDYHFPSIYEIAISSEKVDIGKIKLDAYSSGSIKDLNAYMELILLSSEEGEVSPQNYSYLYRQLQNAIMHELTHLFDASNASYPKYQGKTRHPFVNEWLSYYMDPFETEAFARGLYYLSKKARKPFESILSRYLSGQISNFEERDIDKKTTNESINLVYNTILQKAKDMNLVKDESSAA